MTHKRSRVAESKSAVVSAIPLACADEPEAVRFLEEMRWGDKPECPRCGYADVRMMTGKDGKRNARFLWRCYQCKRDGRNEQFSWRIGTVAEDSRIPARCWTYAIWRASTSKKGVSALEIKRQTGLSYKSALFLMHRIRHGMTAPSGPEGTLSGDVICDEMYVGGRPRDPLPQKGRTAIHHDRKAPVVALVEPREGGRVRVSVVANVTARTVSRFLDANSDKAGRLMTDESNVYRTVGGSFAGGHHRVNHSAREFARGDITTNHAESFFALVRRGLHGTWHAVSEAHLPLYVGEFAFRWNTRLLEDGQRLKACVRAMQGKRLTYKPTPEDAA